MRSCIHAAALAAALSPQASMAAGPLSQEEVIALSERRNPALIAARAQVAAARGELEDVRAPLWNDPEVLTESRRRSLGQTAAPDVTRYDAALGLSQRFQLGGQQQARRGAAEAGERAVAQSIEDVRREVRAEAAQRFFQVLSLQERVRTEEQALELLRQAAELTAQAREGGGRQPARRQSSCDRGRARRKSKGACKRAVGVRRAPLLPCAFSLSRDFSRKRPAISISEFRATR